MKKKKDDENLTPWARYQKEHNQRNRTKKSSKLGGAKRGTAKKHPGKKRNKLTQKKVRQPLHIGKGIKIGLLSLIGILILVTIYLCAPISRVQTIAVQGNKRVEKSDILKKVTVRKNDVIPATWFKERGDEAHLIHKLPDLKDAQISVSLLGNVKIKVRENAVMGYVVRNKYYYAVRQDGTVSKKKCYPTRW
ncbi:hypothetical protein [Pediococcus acidilactici]|uniref:hypothetical protein n=1 Tax=Pediococcus acidilactici TaxID=1254 RepID=UPI001E617EF0|nr:hypothetical protein [Pediococcus acidilactici]